MKGLSITADIVGILSFIISISTFFTALGIRKKMIVHVAKTDYLQEIDNQIKNLTSYYESIFTDDIYNLTILEKIDVTLDDLLIEYGAILPKDVVSDMKKLQNHIKDKCIQNISDRDARRKCTKQLHLIASKLAKEKKLI